MVPKQNRAETHNLPLDLTFHAVFREYPGSVGRKARLRKSSEDNDFYQKSRFQILIFYLVSFWGREAERFFKFGNAVESH